MDSIDKKSLSERDICTKYITPAIQSAGWDVLTQVREEVSFTDGRVIVKGKTTARAKTKRADYLLYFKPGIPIAVVEAKDNKHTVGAGMQQALTYSHPDCLDLPFAISSNGDAFLIHDRTGTYPEKEFEVSMDALPSPAELWHRYGAVGNVLIDVQQVIPLPEAEDYQIKVREKKQADRVARRTSRDYSRFSVTVQGKTTEGMPKRRAIHAIVKALCESGATPEDIAQVIDWKTSLFYSLPGSLDSQAFNLAFESGAGSHHQAKRWFYADDELVRCGDRTHAFTNQWGRRTEEAMEKLIRHFKPTDITYKKSN